MPDIDLVYLWVNGNDPEWLAKYNAWTGKEVAGGANCKGRYADNEELKYSLRSVERYAPWIRRIFIVTDHQVPAWLDTSHPKIQIVDHTEIMPTECLPCFNSRVIESHMHRIPGLSERFIYANDDMMFSGPVTPDTFYAADGLPIFRLCRRPFRKLVYLFNYKVLRKTLSNYQRAVHHAALLVEKKYGVFFGDSPHHNIDAYLKSDYEHTRAVFKDEIDPMLCNRVRTENDVQRSLYTYAALAEKRGHRLYVNRDSSIRIQIHRSSHYDRFKRFSPTFFCINDTEFANDSDRQRAHDFLETLFPDKSRFEK